MTISRLWWNQAKDLIISLFPITISKVKTKESTFIKIAKKFANCPFLTTTGSKPKTSYSTSSNPLKMFMKNLNPKKNIKTKPISSRQNLKLTWFIKKGKLSKANKNNANLTNIQNVNLKNIKQMHSKRKKMKNRTILTFFLKTNHLAKDLSKFKDTKFQSLSEKATIRLKKLQLRTLCHMIKCKPLTACWNCKFKDSSVMKKSIK